jgi:D-glycero-D-manno-heptose 1,7-bisphosphate phosphatase
MLRAVIFDRDGVLIEDTGYPHRPEDLHWLPGAIDAVAYLNRKNILALVATNQSGVARGYFSERDVQRFHDLMQEQLSDKNAHIDRFYYCPFHAAAVVPEYRHADHPDRKPNPGMILKALGDWSLEPREMVMIGDRDSDVEAATRAGARSALYTGGDLKAIIENEVRR